jgi:(2R)-3-sulfolactate dehydrogenase (NADP+)
MALIPVAELTVLAAAALRASGASASMARVTAKYLVAAEAQGLATHGVMRVPSYCGHLASGRANGAAAPKIINEKPAACLIDAGNGLGFESCEYAVEQAIARACNHGTGFAGVTNSHHCGALGILLEPVAAAGMVGLAFSNASAAIMAWGGKRPLFGTNPVAAIFPRKQRRADSLPAEPAVRGQRAQTLASTSDGFVNEQWRGSPLVIDLSLTQVTRGQIMLLAKEGKPIPEGWGMDKDGHPTTDPQKILVGGSLYAVGGLKGTMLALAVELLCCALAGAALSHEVASMHTADGPPLRLGQAFLAIDPAALAGRDVYFERVETLVAAMLEDEGVRLPGDRRHALVAKALQSGIEIPDDLERQLRELAYR